MRRRAALAASLLALGLAACDDSTDEPEPAPPPPPAPEETIDHVPRLPDDWKHYFNRRGGFAFGAPPGWKVADRGAGSLVRSFDRLLAMSIVADRTPAALETPVAEYAERATDALTGYRTAPRVKGEAPFDHRYEGAAVRAVGTAEGGVGQRISVIVLRRDELVTFTVVLARNAERAAGPSKRLALRVIGTLRGRPPAGAQQRGD